MDLDQKRKEYHHSLDTALERIIIQVSGILEIQKVISFGSYASGKRDLFTDIDLIVIMETEKEFIQRTAYLYQLLHSDVDLGLLVYSPEEFKKIQGGSFLREALQNGQVIYEK